MLLAAIWNGSIVNTTIRRVKLERGSLCDVITKRFMRRADDSFGIR